MLGFVDEFAPFAVLFTLWFDDNGVSIGEISVAFAVWTVVAFVAEIPGGALADRMDRRHLLAAALATRAIGLAVWLVWPTFVGLLVGSTLWALHDAAASGSWEALIHDELTAEGNEGAYGATMARVGQASHIGLALAALVSTPLLGLGLSLAAMGWFTLALHVVPLALILTLPNVQWVVEQSRVAEAAERAAELENDATQSPRGALRRALTDRGVLILAGVAAGLGGLAIFDDYIALVARERGASDALIPLVFLSVWIGLVVGGEVAARRPDLSSRTLSAAIVFGGTCSFAGLAVGSLWALAGIGVGYAALEATWVISDARLQARVPAHVRATVSSVRELGVGVVFGLALAVVALMSIGGDPTPGLTALTGLIVAIGLAARWLPED